MSDIGRTRALLVIGTRGSPLALAQAREAARRLADAVPDLAATDAIAIEPITTTGDRRTDRVLADIGGKGLFTKELEEALAEGRIDCAVHSMKDVPTWLPEGLVVDCLLPREDPRDAWFGRDGATPATLPAGAAVGTASLRRQAQLLALRPDLRVVPLRGNVGTRLAKLAAGEVDATMLAAAGLNRLGLADRATALLEPHEMLPAVGQGAIGIERRAGDDRVAGWLARIHCRETGLRVAAERAMLEVLDGSCRTPIGGLATIRTEGPDGPRLALDGLVAAPDGRRVVARRAEGPADDARRLGREVGDAIAAGAGAEMMTEIRRP